MESAEVGFRPGLNLLSGETGSGKSLIVDALGLCLGAPASSDQIREGAKRATAEAVFEVDQPGSAEASEPQQLILGRELAGRSSARLNGGAVELARLRELGRQLVAVHGQHEQHLLLDAEAQALMLDGYGDLGELRASVMAIHAEWAGARSRLDQLLRQQARGEREEQYLRAQLEELEAARLAPGEDLELGAERSALRHATQLGADLDRALEAMEEEGGLERAQSLVRSASEFDPRLADLAQALGGLLEQATDLRSELRRRRESVEPDPVRLEEVEARLSQIETLKRRYGGTLEEVLTELERLRGQVGTGISIEDSISGARSAVETGERAYMAVAQQLSAGRASAAARLAGAAELELRALRLEQARLEIRLEPRLEPSPQGLESVAIHFSANPGESLRPLARVASGGELSRLMLALKTVAAESDSVPTLVFDEIDAGIGGEAAVQVGLRLARLGRRRQVLVVTHLAQIACFAEHHLVVEKVAEASGRNVVRVRELVTAQERAAELARMMSGGVTQKAIERALELMAEAAASG